MNDGVKQALKDALGDRFAESGGEVTVTPADERELATVLRLLREHGGRQHHGLTISRARMNALGVIEPKSGTVEVGAGMALDRLEQELRLRDLSLGPLSPGALKLDVANFIEGPYAGLRVVPGGRLEPIPLALVALMADGLRYVSRPSPRSAAGPDLDALFLGGEGRAGLVVQATLRCFARPRAERVAVYSFSAPSTLLDALRGAIAQGCWLRRASMLTRGGRYLLAVEVIGSPEGVERDLSSLGQEVFSRGGRSSGQDTSIPGGPRSEVERELSWAEVSGLVSAGRALTLYRLSLESVIAVGLEEGGVPLLPGSWMNAGPLAAVMAQADPGGILGGAP